MAIEIHRYEHSFASVRCQVRSLNDFFPSTNSGAPFEINQPHDSSPQLPYPSFGPFGN